MDAKLREMLQAQLDPKLIKSRPAGDRAGNVDYIEAHTAIAQANRIFGFDGWSYRIDQFGQEEGGEGRLAYAVFWAIVTVDALGVSRTDMGTHELRNGVDKRSGREELKDNVHNPDQRGMARKGAVSDALKRALRSFGEQWGNGLYDEDGDVYRWMQQQEEVASAHATAQTLDQIIAAIKQEAQEQGVAPSNMGRFQALNQLAGEFNYSPSMMRETDLTPAWASGLYEAMRVRGARELMQTLDSIEDTQTLLDFSKHCAIRGYDDIANAAEQRLHVMTHQKPSATTQKREREGVAPS